MRLRSILLGCLLLIVVALAAAATLLFVRPSAYRGPVEWILSAALGSPVKIEGSFELDPGPPPRIELSKLSIGPRSPDSPAIGRVGRLELEVVLAKLFLGVLDVRWLGLFDTQLAFVSSGKDTSTDAASSKGFSLPFGLIPVVEGARLENFELRYRAAAAEHETTLQLERGTVAQAEESSERVFEAHGKVNGHSLALSGRVGPIAELFEPSQPYTVSMDGELMGAKLSAAGTFGEPLALRGIDLGLQASAPELADLLRPFHVELPPIGPFTATIRLGGDHDRIRLSNLSLKMGKGALLRATLQGQVQNVQALQGVDLRLAAETSSLSTLSPLVGMDLPKTGGIHIHGHLTDQDGTLGIEELHFKRKSEAAHIQLQGKFGHLRELDEIDLSLEVRAEHLSALATLFDMQLPAVGPVEISGTLAGGPDRVELKPLKAQLGSTRITGQASGSYGKGGPEFVAELRSDDVKLADLGLGLEARDSPADDETVPPTEARLLAWLGNEKELPLGWLDSVDGSLSLAAERISGPNAALHQFRALMKLHEGVMDLAHLEASVGGGQIEGAARVDATTPQPSVTLSARATGIDLSRLGKAAEAQISLQGMLDAAFELESRGRSAKLLASNLNGRAGLALRRAHIDPGGGLILNSKQLRSVLYQGPHWDESPMACFAGRWDIHSGIVTDDPIIYQTTDTVVRVEGSLDLERRQLDLVLIPKSLKSVLFDLTMAVNVSGPFSDVSITTNKTGVAKGVAGAMGGDALVKGARKLLPFVSAGTPDDELCEQIATQLSTQGIAKVRPREYVDE